MRNSEEFGWLKEYNVTTERYALKDLLQAFQKFFLGINRYPKMKTKKKHSYKCSIRDDRIRFKGENGNLVFIPGISLDINDLIDCDNHNIPHGSHIEYNNVRIKFDGVCYWLSLSVKVRQPIVCDIPYYPTGEGLGVDVGVRTSAYLSDGTECPAPNRARIKNLFKRQSAISRKISADIYRRRNIAERTKAKYEDIPKSKNQIKREQEWHKTYNRIRNIYTSNYHKISRDIANRKPRFVVLEEISVESMERTSKSKHIKHDIHTSSLTKLISFIDYKCRDNGSRIIYAPRGFKSSQICSHCGNITNPGSSKMYKCPYCGLVIDRDFNAALNLKAYGISQLYR